MNSYRTASRLTLTCVRLRLWLIVELLRFLLAPRIDLRHEATGSGWLKEISPGIDLLHCILTCSAFMPYALGRGESTAMVY